MFRSLILAVGCLLVPSVASAATLSIDAPDESYDPWGFEVEYSGAADVPSNLYIYAAKDATTCPATSGGFSEEYTGRGRSVGSGMSIPAGPFKGELELGNGGTADLEPGPWLVCAYLTPEAGATDTPSATATDSLTNYAAKLAVRTYTGNCFRGSPKLEFTSFGIYHGTRGTRWDGQQFAATVKLVVSSATRSRHGLPSTVLMQGSFEGSGGRWAVRPSPAVARKLKRIKRLRAAYVIRYTAPFTETVTRDIFFVNNSSGKQSKGCGLVYLSSSGDRWPPAVSGGSGSIGGGKDDGVGDRGQ